MNIQLDPQEVSESSYKSTVDQLLCRGPVKQLFHGKSDSDKINITSYKL